MCVSDDCTGFFFALWKCSHGQFDGIILRDAGVDSDLLKHLINFIWPIKIVGILQTNARFSLVLFFFSLVERSHCCCGYEFVSVWRLSAQLICIHPSQYKTKNTFFIKSCEAMFFFVYVRKTLEFCGPELITPKTTTGEEEEEEIHQVISIRFLWVNDCEWVSERASACASFKTIVH